MYLPTGTRLGPYKIEAPIGAGGMGEVYRATDTRLDRSVAVKILSSRVTSEPNAKQRFEREAHAASALNHPHICTIYDVGEHDGQQFLVMELLEGVTLKQYMGGQALGVEQLLKLGMQIADALQTAHNKGVIHRDVKPTNVFVTEGGEVKVLDFGLAKLLPASDQDATLSLTLTEPQAVLGTLPYMAPEQLRGEKTDARTDIWGVGAVLYEMATGHLPFREELATRLTDAILHQAPASPRVRKGAIPPEMERIILKCLEKDPENRYQSAKELVVDLRRLAEPATAATAHPSTMDRAHRRSQVLAGLALVVLVGMLSALSFGELRERLFHAVHPSPNTGAVARNPNSPRAVAVIGFKNLSGRASEAWLSTAFSEMLTSELSAGGDLRTIPGEDVARMKIELSLPDSDSYSHETLSRIRKDIGTDLVLVGSYLDMGKDAGGKVRLDLRLQDAAGGETLAVLTETGTEAEILDLVSRTGSRLREKLGVGELAAAEVSGLRASYPSNPEAARYYAEGLARLRKYDALAARPLLEKAVAADPSYALAHSALSEAWSRLGYDAKASTEAKHAFAVSQKLSSEEKSEVEGRYRETTHEWDKAVEIYRALWASSQNKLENGLRLARAQGRAGKLKDELATLGTLRKLPPPERDDPRIDLSESWAAGSLGDPTRAQAAAANAASKAEANGARILLANARGEESWALEQLGKVDDARAALEDVKRVASEMGDRGLFAEMLVSSGNVLETRGDLAGAARTYEEALATFEDIGAKSGVATALWAIAGVHEDRGNFAEAESKWRQALAAYRDIADRRSSARALERIGWTIFCRGDLVGAERKYEESRSIIREIGYSYSTAWLEDKQASLLVARDDVEGAKKLQEESLEIVKRLESAADTAHFHARLSETLLEEGRHSEAVKMAASGVQEARAARDLQSESEAHAVAAEGLLAQGEIPEAKKEIDQAQTHMTELQWWHRMRILVIAARVRAASRQSPDIAESAKDLRPILEEARKKNTPQIQFEARLALGEIELASSNPAAGRTELAALVRDARAKDFRLIARKASTALAKHS